MTVEEIRPSGHVQIVERRAGRRWHALWRDADGRHQRVLGPAWVKDSGRRTPRGAIVWRAADGRKPHASYLSPAQADDLLRQILAGAPRRATRPRPGTGTRFMDVAENWMLHGERKRGLKRSTLRDYRYTLDGHLLPAFGDQEIAAITREGVERWHARYPRSRMAEKVLVVLGAIMRYAQRRELVTTNPVEKLERALPSATPATTTLAAARRSTRSRARPPSSSRTAWPPSARSVAGGVSTLGGG